MFNERACLIWRRTAYVGPFFRGHRAYPPPWQDSRLGELVETAGLTPVGTMTTSGIDLSPEQADAVIDLVDRQGDANGRQLDHAYTLMTEYVCPVGALTASDFDVIALGYL